MLTASPFDLEAALTNDINHDGEKKEEQREHTPLAKAGVGVKKVESVQST